MDDQEKNKDRERQKLLEQIRRKAEEAELKRIEEEEQRADLLARPAPPPPPPPAPLPPPAITPRVSRDDERIKDLREKFSLAIDRGKADKAAELLDELSLLDIDRDEVDSLRERLDLLKKQQEEVKAKKRAADQHAREAAAQEKVKRESAQKKIGELFQQANSFYQGEKYDRALETLNDLLGLDPDNEEARHLNADITKAKDLAERVREEEARRRAEEAALTPHQSVKEPPPPQTPGEIWGSKEVLRSDDEIGLPPVAEDQAASPHAPLLDRVVDRLSRVHIPLRPVLIGLGVLVLGVAAYIIISQLKEAVFPPKYSLLVLPAGSPNDESSAQFFSEAVTEDLINTVAVVSDLRVVGVATTLSLRSSAGDVSQIARVLGASYYLLWTASRSPDRVAFQVTLFDTLSKNSVWSTQYQTSVRELQSVTRELALAILREMKVPMSPEDQQNIGGAVNTSGDAYGAYARGRWYLHQVVPGAIDSAVSAFTVSVGMDSLFIASHLGLAWAHLLAAERDDDPSLSHVQLAWRFLNEALALGARSSESYRIRGVIAQDQAQYDRAVEELERAVALAPSDAESQRRLSLLYVIKGRSDDAMKAASRALADDPRNVESCTLVGMIHLLRGEDNEALRSFEQGLLYAPDKSAYASAMYADVLEYTHQPDKAAQILIDRSAQTQNFADYYRLGRVYQAAGRPKQQWESVLQRAKTVLEAAGAAGALDAVGYSYLALTETRLGSFKSALEASGHARQLAPNNADVLYNTARLFALQTDKAQALEYLRKATDAHYRLSDILDMDFYNLRSEPEFLAAITR